MVKKGYKVNPLRKLFKGLYKKCECPGKDGNGCKTLIPVLKRDKPIFQRFAYQHQHIGKFGKEAVGYKTGMTEDKTRGYVIITRRHHKYAGTRGRIYLHRYLKELDLGYYITKEYDIDHINGDKKDNIPENLQVLLKGDHTSKHHTIPDRSNTFCILCNTKTPNKFNNGRPKWYKYLDGYICDVCYNREYKKRKKVKS